jgi:hypothetical protein
VKLIELSIVKGMIYHQRGQHRHRMLPMLASASASASRR